MDRQKLMAMIREDAAKLGITPEQFIQRFQQGKVVMGAPSRARPEADSADYEIPGPQTHLTTNGADLQIVDRLQGEPDDFDELVERRQHALQTADGDSFAQEVLLQQQDRARLNKEAPFTRSNPPSLLSGVLGSQAQVSQGADPITVATWVGDNSETTAVSCLFANVVRDQLATGGQIRPFGRVIFGTLGYSITMDVDIGRGCQFCVPASQVTLLVGLDPGNNGGVDPATTTNLTGMLSFGPALRTTAITRTSYIDPGAGATKTIQRPVFASNVMVFRKDLTGSVQLDFEDSNNVIVYTYLLAANAQMTDPIPLTSDVTQIVVTRSVTPDKARLIWGLSL